MNSFSVLWRRKGLAFTLLILTLLGAVGAGIMLPWTYNASITETLLDSKQSSEALGGGNPYLSFNSPMVEMANLLAMKLTSSANTLALQENGYTASFQTQVLSETPENEEPFIQISVSGSNQEVVARTLQGVAASLSASLTELQADVPPQSRLSLQSIAEVSTPVRSSSSKIKPFVGLLGVGLVLTFLIPQAVEGSARRRRKIRAGGTTSVRDRSTSQGFSREAESARFHSNYTAGNGSQTFQQQWRDRQIEDDFQGQNFSPTRQGGNTHSNSEYDIPSPGGGHPSEAKRPWLYRSKSIHVA